MGFTTNEGRVRIDLFRDTGKWYATGSICMADFYRGDIFEGVLRACEREFVRADQGEWPVTTSPREWLEREGTIIVLEPYHEHAHPIMLTRGRALKGGA